MFSLEALLKAARAGGWEPKTKPSPGNYAFHAVFYALIAAGIAVWLG